jgi:glycosyltransferase involved in cell wall biosynthesis
MGSDNKNNQLAIVIPAYKARFLRQALESIARQTDKRFKVYVGDDASPDNIKAICDDFAHLFELVYTRFDENLGRNSLVAHWNRCIEASTEPWVWLFCDDDVMEPGCVEMFYKTIDRQQDQFNVLRFNTLTIDDENQIIRINPPHPLTESGIQFIYHRLKGERLSYVSEYIFSREAYLNNEGMVDFPLAWGSDDASWLAFSQNNGILTIQGTSVLWRRGAYNITPSGAKHQIQRIEAAFRFVNWLDNFIKTHGTESQFVTRDMIKILSQNWFVGQLRGVAPIQLQNCSRFSSFINSIMQRGWIRSYASLAIINLKHYLMLRQ